MRECACSPRVRANACELLMREEASMNVFCLFLRPGSIRLCSCSASDVKTELVRGHGARGTAVCV